LAEPLAWNQERAGEQWNKVSEADRTIVLCHGTGETGGAEMWLSWFRSNKVNRKLRRGGGFRVGQRRGWSLATLLSWWDWMPCPRALRISMKISPMTSDLQLALKLSRFFFLGGRWMAQLLFSWQQGVTHIEE
jgi:hypothetical protein